MFVLVGILVFIYMLLVKPEGTLRVAYTKAFAVGGDSALSTTASTSQALTTPSVGLETLMLLEKLGQLREAGFLTTEEFEAKKADLLARL